ncbi:MAG: hypothetical protein A3D44_01545 [Candidatus Staskawiczbacteria bacterium RIFCSPHIGHO2_02_FULL_42_22]|uniref:Uncharacterized protein n=1 Tax=Candidatus Staskawiczbacteria bacterium RIFCSPHIGHO2_02_FULL_42_22 TaxID=1802207 RepID=A0A1G2HZN3_9BACT|nr:MAG: hypothetical protein A3D44_01545 [Candidatus Staskawiczbacteria bacterium RIFCSPHIGHO2_02_FULL_42_22]
MRISFGKNVKEFRAAQEGRSSPFGGLFADNFSAKLGKNVLVVGKLRLKIFPNLAAKFCRN